MKRTLTTLGTLAILAGAAHAGEISQSVDVNITPDAPIQEFVLNGFDTMAATACSPAFATSSKRA